MRRILTAPAIVLALAAVSPAGAEIKIVTSPSGERLMYNVRGTGGSSSERPGAVVDLELERLIETHAARERLPIRLVHAVIQAESAFNARALSKKGAMGLMQLMPETARDLAVADAFDPGENVRGGTTYLRWMIDRFGDLELALAAYNAGPTAVERHRGIPPYAETRTYVRRVMRLYRGFDRPLAAPRLAALPAGRRPAPEAGRSDASAGTRRPYLVRGPDGKLLLTTERPGS